MGDERLWRHLVAVLMLLAGKCEALYYASDMRWSAWDGVPK